VAACPGGKLKVRTAHRWVECVLKSWRSEEALVCRAAGVKLRGPEGAKRPRATSAAGWPRRIAPPGLPQIRTCGFPASGSSGHGFAIPGAIRPSCVEMLLRTRCSGTFPPYGSMTRSPLPSAGSLGQLSQRSSVLWVTPTPQRPSRFALVVPRLGSTDTRLATPSETLGCLRFAAFLPALAVVRPRKARFRLVANLAGRGSRPRKVPNEVSASSTWLPPHPSFRNAINVRVTRLSFCCSPVLSWEPPPRRAMHHGRGDHVDRRFDSRGARSAFVRAAPARRPRRVDGLPGPSIGAHLPVDS
jgi:hypothetical protein